MAIKGGVYHEADNIIKALVTNELLVQLRKDVEQAVRTEVSVELENAIRDMVYKNVYDTYINRGYIRRGDKGGLSDTNKYDTRVYPLNANETVAETFVNVNGSQQYLNIVPIIESGRGYNWKNSEIYKTKQPRPFLQEAAELIVQDHSALGAVADYLKRVGWEVYMPYARKHATKADHGNPNAIADELAEDAFGDYYAEDGDVF